MWEDDTPATRFWQRLVRERAIEFMQSPEYLKKLRFDYDRAKADQKLFGHVWAEYGVSVFQLIAEAYGEKWDAEDEEKHCTKKEAAVTQRDDDDLVAAREGGSLEGLDKLQGEPQAGLCVVEEEKGRKSLGSDDARGSAEEEAPQKESRGASFYRRAGGT